jgi:MFS family permease
MSSSNTTNHSASASIINNDINEFPKNEQNEDPQFITSNTNHHDQDLEKGSIRPKSVSEKIRDNEPVPLSDLDWDSPEDPGNPKNWSKPYRWFVTMVAAWMCLVVTFGSSLYTAGIFKIMAKFHASQTLALAGLTFYLLGLSLGPILGAPMSEILGRKPVYVISLPLSMLFVMGVGLSKNIGSILVLRFFAGFFASPVMAIAGGTISDIWEVEMTGVAMSSFCLAPFAGPVLGPIIGGFAMVHKNWAWTQWIHLFFSGAILPFVIILPETYKPAIMRKRAKQRGITIEKPKFTPLQMLKLLFVITVARPLEMFVVEPIVVVLSLYTSLVFSILFGFFEAYPVIFRGIYHMDGGVSGLTFLGIGVGLLISTVIYIYIDRTIYFPKNADGTRGRRDEKGNLIPSSPEAMLLPAKIGAPLLPIALFWQAWTARNSVHWMAPIAAGAPFGMSLMLIFYSVLLYFTYSYPPIILASALAANNLARYILASVFPLFTVQMYQNLGVDWASSLFGFIAIAMMPIPWIFTKYGPYLRKASKFNKQAAAQAAAPSATDDAESIAELELSRTLSYRQ